MLDRYVAQVRLLLSTVQDIANETVFALKGGTAINLFYRDMPRLSVDIDLTYLPVADRQVSLKNIDDALDRIVAAIVRHNPRLEARRATGGGNADTRIMVSDGQSQIKIETSPVARGAVYPARTTADLFRTFMVYVASSGRPMHELLAPTAPLNEELYGEEFVGMTRQPVSWNALIETRRRLHADIGSRLTGDVADFLVALHDADPDFHLIGVPEAADLPAVLWKLVNLKRLKQADPQKHKTQRDALVRLFR